MASFLSLLQPAVLLMLPAVFATMIYLGLGGVLGAFLLRLKQVAFVLVNVPLGIWCLTHGWFVAGTATLGVGLGVGIGVVEYFVDPVSPPLQTARLWTLAVGLVAVVILFVQGACGYYPEAPKRTRSAHRVAPAAHHVVVPDNGPQPRHLSGATIATVVVVLLVIVPLALTFLHAEEPQARPIRRSASARRAEAPNSVSRPRLSTRCMALARRL